MANPSLSAYSLLLSEHIPENLIAHIISSKHLLRPKQIRAILESSKCSFLPIWLDPGSFVPHIITAEQTERIELLRSSDMMRQEHEHLARHGIRICSLADQTYPESLRHIHNPPIVLYYRGVLQTNMHSVGSTHDDLFPLAIIGSRKVSGYGKRAIEEMVSGLTQLPVSIISGMAIGADGIAHRAALSHGLHTIAVLGSGVDEPSIYPQSHGRLASDIVAAGGCVLSEYPPGTKAHAGYFPMRNRIIAGMSTALLVAEAAARSGTLITAYSAIEHGRDVWAIPGSIFSAYSSGTNGLIARGAYLAQDAQSIIAAYPQLRSAQQHATHTFHSGHSLLHSILDSESQLIRTSDS